MARPTAKGDGRSDGQSIQCPLAIRRGLFLSERMNWDFHRESDALLPVSMFRVRPIVLCARIALAAAFVIATPAWSHETWVPSAKSRMERSGSVTLLATSGMSFPRPATAGDPKWLQASGAMIAR